MNYFLRTSIKVFLINLFIVVLTMSLSAQDEMKHVLSFDVGGDGAAEIVAYDATTERLWVLNNPNGTIDIFDFCRLHQSGYDPPVRLHHLR